jgi:SAM-dependent methyltransferase
VSAWNVAGAIVGGLLALLWLFDAMRVRGRAKAMAALMPSDEPASDSHVFLVRPGVTIDDATKRAASAHARKSGIEVLDLVAPDISAWRLLIFLAQLDPAKYRADRVVRGVTAGDAILVDRGVLERSGVSATPKDAVAFVDTARTLKRYAVVQTDAAVALGLRSPGVALRERRRIVRMLYGEYVGTIVAVQYALLAFTLALAPPFGAAALIAFLIQPMNVFFGTRFLPKDVLAYALFRPLVDLASVFGPVAKPPEPRVASESLRATYDALLARGMDGFFEPPRTECPICRSSSLRKAFTLGDRYQFKPGRFTLTRCNDCGHVFQNPRLSIEGLSFYYRDFYDGLGEEPLEEIFAAEPSTYRGRVDMVRAAHAPKRWLDVGAGHGHFCCVAKESLAETSFDGLDLSESIDIAKKRRWIDESIRGLFPEVASDLATRGYDTISMSHYLEHTLDPRAEIAAAARVLAPGGFLFIEVPDPDCIVGKVLGRNWMPWFQPQHLHFVSVKNIDKILREQSFEPVAWHRGEAHQTTDITFFVYMILDHVAPPTEFPWRPPSSALARGWRRVVWSFGFPILAFAWLADRALAPLFRRPGWSNTYRVLARRVA